MQIEFPESKYFPSVFCRETRDLQRERIQVVRSNRVVQKRPAELNGPPAMDPGHMNIDLRYIFAYCCAGKIRKEQFDFYFILQAATQLAGQVHPKTLFEIAMVLSTSSGSFPSNSHVSATFSILLRFGESWNPTNFERFNADGSLMGRTNLDKSVW